MIQWKRGSSGGSAVITGTEAEVDEGIAEVEREYHPAGYGTTFTERKHELADGSWRAVMHWYGCE